MRRVTLLTALACLVLASCTGTHTALRRRAGQATATPSPAASGLRLGRSTPPPVRMFAGTQSVVGTPVRYCSGGNCVSRNAQPPRLLVEAGSVVTFAVGRTPTRAAVDITGALGGRVSLTTATLMVLKDRLAPGPHRLTLTLRWLDGEGIWVFQVSAKR